MRMNLLCSVLLLAGTLAVAPAFDSKTSADHGRDVLDRIVQQMARPGSDIYQQEIKPADAAFKPGPDDCWAAGVQLTALTAAAKVDPDKYLPALKRYTLGLDTFRATINGVEGYDDGPHPKPPDRYYDDNAWIALGMIEAYEITHEPKDLERAKVALGLTLSGEDEKLGGGLYWRESAKESKNTCGNAPAIVAAVRMWQVTHDGKMLATAVRLYKWTRATLLDGSDQLYFDNVRLDGKIAHKKWTYNSALMIRAGCVLYSATNDKQYLDDAEKTAAAAVKGWCDPETGAIDDPACFAHLLAESLLELTARDHDPRWAEADHRAIAFLWAQVRDNNGFYPERWNTGGHGLVADVRLIDQASAARAYFRAAWAGPAGQ
jgi:rhamnogalacturonyl hydrolase YesR